ncbi:MAG: selenite/tellurite reduction operon c-type cytochrome lipoprotein ExtS [Vicinamibacteria bacterium]
MRAPAARPDPQAGCVSCHSVHHVEQGSCASCHRGAPGARRKELGHERLLSGRVAEHALPGSAAVREGEQLVARAACRRCHTIAGEGNRHATNLDRVVWTRGQAELLASIRAPVENMPAFGFDAPQAEAIVASLLSRRAQADEPETYRVLFRAVAAAPSVFEEKCGGCHRRLGAGGPQGVGRAGPNLSGLFTAFYPPTARGEVPWTATALEEWLRNPRAVRPQAVMPPVPLTPEERKSLLGELAD